MSAFVAMLPVPAALAGAVPANAAAETGLTSGIASLLQTGIGLAAVLVLIFACAWAARRFGLRHHGNDRMVKVIASTMIGQRERIVIIEVGASWLVLGVTASRINTLHTMPAERAQMIETAPAAAVAGMFAEKLRACLTGFRRPDY